MPEILVSFLFISMKITCKRFFEFDNLDLFYYFGWRSSKSYFDED